MTTRPIMKPYDECTSEERASYRMFHGPMATTRCPRKHCCTVWMEVEFQIWGYYGPCTPINEYPSLCMPRMKAGIKRMEEYSSKWQEVCDRVERDGETAWDTYMPEWDKPVRFYVERVRLDMISWDKRDIGEGT